RPQVPCRNTSLCATRSRSRPRFRDEGHQDNPSRRKEEGKITSGFRCRCMNDVQRAGQDLRTERRMKSRTQKDARPANRLLLRNLKKISAGGAGKSTEREKP